MVLQIYVHMRIQTGSGYSGGCKAHFENRRKEQKKERNSHITYIFCLTFTCTHLYNVNKHLTPPPCPTPIFKISSRLRVSVLSSEVATNAQNYNNRNLNWSLNLHIENLIKSNNFWNDLLNPFQPIGSFHLLNFLQFLRWANTCILYIFCWF